MIFVWPICLNNFHPDTNRLQLWFMLCAQQISVLLLDGICPHFTGVIKTQPAEFHTVNLSTSLIFPPKWVLFTDPCFTRYKKSLSDSQTAPSTPQHPTAKNTNTHTHTLSDGSLETSEGSKPCEHSRFSQERCQLNNGNKTLRFVGKLTLVSKNPNVTGYSKISYTQQQTCWLVILNYRRYFKHNLEKNNMKHYFSKFP